MKSLYILFFVIGILICFVVSIQFSKNSKDLGNTVFKSDSTIDEASSPDKSISNIWWVSSGARFVVKNNSAQTIIGELPQSTDWNLKYLKNNPIDTDNGYHPQNIFRLVNISKKWKDFSATVYFKIVNDNLSSSPNRNASNGLLLMTRYVDANNLYYAGYRVDGTFVVKKKKEGKYYTLAQVKINIDSLEVYDFTSSPNLLPHNEWLGLRVEVSNLENNAVNIKVYSDIGKKGTWTEVINTVDDGIKNGGSALVDEGFVGIRTDFMDVKFDDFAVNSL